MSSKEFLTEFIDVYRQHTALWKIKSSEYVNKNLKRLGYCALIEVCKKYKIKGDEAFVKRKIQSLRSTFRKEFNKVERSIRSGSGSDDIYSPNLWYYDSLMFIKDQEQATPSISNIRSPSVLSEDTNNEDDGNAVENNDRESHNPETQESLESMHDSLDGGLDSQILTPSATPHTSNTLINTDYITKERQKKKKQRKEDLTEHRNFLQVCTNALASATSNEVADDSAAFGAYVGSKLKTITDTSQKMHAEMLITQILQKAVMNKLSETTIVTDQREPRYVNTFWSPHQHNAAHTSSHYITDNNIASSSGPGSVPSNNVNIVSETPSVSQYYPNFETL